jgi:tetratricopeptide (TPR) repeat protein
MRSKGGNSNRRPLSHSKKNNKNRKSRNQPQTEKRIVSTSKSKTRQKTPKKPAQRPITGGRLWLFRIVALIVIPILLFLLLELGLRIVGYGFPSAASVKCEVDGEKFYCDNIKFGWRFFPKNIAREFDPFTSPVDKSDDTYRVFVLGASAAKGEPDSAYCFGRFLEIMLRQQYPEINFEVITPATAAINSHVVVEIARDCSRHQPDLFIVYLGNNEVIGPYGAGTVFNPISGSLSLIRFSIALKSTRFGQLLTNLLASIGLERNIPKVWGGMEMFLEKQVRPGDEQLETVYRHFERNLKDIKRIAAKSGVKIIFCTVPSNIKDCPPFASLHRADLQERDKKKWDEIYRQAVAYEEADNYEQAVAKYLEAAEIDDSYADLQFRLGRCYWAIAGYDKARERYVQARELDTLRFRADNRINEIIHSVAVDKTARGIYLVDAVKAFEKNSPYETTGHELFYEHVHPNFKGNYLLANTILRQVEEILPDHIKRHKGNKLPYLTEEQCGQLLAYTPWDQYKVTDKVLNDFVRKPPFTNQLYHDELVKTMEQTLNKLRANLTVDILQESAAQYRFAIQNDSNDWYLRYKYGKLLTEDLKDFQRAIEQYRLIQHYFPSSYTGYDAMGSVLYGMGNYDAAIDQYLKVIQIKPTYADVYSQLGWLYRKLGKADKALKYYAESLRIIPTNPSVRFSFGLTYQNLGRLDKAIEQYREALKIQPDYAEAYNNLAISLYQQGKLNEAVDTYRQGLSCVADNLDLHYNLAVLLKEQGRRDEAIKELRAALQIDPNSAKTHKMLKTLLKYNP